MIFGIFVVGLFARISCQVSPFVIVSPVETIESKISGPANLILSNVIYKENIVVGSYPVIITNANPSYSPNITFKDIVSDPVFTLEDEDSDLTILFCGLIVRVEDYDFISMEGGTLNLAFVQFYFSGMEALHSPIICVEDESTLINFTEVTIMNLIFEGISFFEIEGYVELVFDKCYLSGNGILSYFILPYLILFNIIIIILLLLLLYICIYVINKAELIDEASSSKSNFNSHRHSNQHDHGGDDDPAWFIDNGENEDGVDVKYTFKNCFIGTSPHVEHEIVEVICIVVLFIYFI
jgi:hypothetical protein